MTLMFRMCPGVVNLSLWNLGWPIMDLLWAIVAGRCVEECQIQYYNGMGGQWLSRKITYLGNKKFVGGGL